ncbi:MAG: rhomboid family intramembrane serine protease [Pseudomonadota bacterium]
MIPIRDENPATLTPVITVLVLIACVGVFVWQLSLGRANQLAVLSLGLTPKVLFGLASLPSELTLVPPVATVFSSMFLHGSILHIGSNMLYLWVFGDNVESELGHVGFALFYLACGVAAALAQAIPDPTSTVPMIGASGAISGILGAYMILFPTAKVSVLFPPFFFLRPIPLPAVLVLGAWFALQLLASQAAPVGEGGGGVAFRAHIGGFIAGILLLSVFPRRKHRPQAS